MQVAYGYVRLSKDDSTKPSLSPDAQMDVIQNYCILKHLTCKQIFVDVDVSGGLPIAEREAGKALLSVLDTKGLVVVCARLDRLFRNLEDAVTTAKGWERLGIVPVCVAEGIDLTTPTGRLAFAIYAAFGQYERELIGERTKAVLDAKRARGERVSRYAPYGFDFGSDGVLIPNAGELLHLKWMRNLRTRGDSYADIAAKMNEAGYPAKAGGKWGASSVRAVLSKKGQTTRKAMKDATPRIGLDKLAPEDVQEFDAAHGTDPYSTEEL